MFEVVVENYYIKFTYGYTVARVYNSSVNEEEGQ